jgi:hypothetical protein
LPRIEDFTGENGENGGKDTNSTDYARIGEVLQEEIQGFPRQTLPTTRGSATPNIYITLTMLPRMNPFYRRKRENEGRHEFHEFATIGRFLQEQTEARRGGGWPREGTKGAKGLQKL